MKTYALAEVKQEWKSEAEEEGVSLSRYLHQLIQESRALRKQGRLKLGDRRRVEELQDRIDELETKLDNQRQNRSNPDNSSKLIPSQNLDEYLGGEFKPLDQILKELVGSEEFQNRLRTELKSELYRLANEGRLEYRRGNGWKCLVAVPVTRCFSASLADFREIEDDLDAVWRYEVQATKGQTV